MDVGIPAIPNPSAPAVPPPADPLAAVEEQAAPTVPAPPELQAAADGEDEDEDDGKYRARRPFPDEPPEQSATAAPPDRGIEIKAPQTAGKKETK